MPAYSKSPLGFPHQSPQCRFPNSRNRATSAARAHVLACPAPGQRHRKEIRANSRARPCCPWMCAESATRSGEIPIGAAGKRSVPDLWPSPCPIPIDCEISQAVPCVLWRRFLECMFPAAMAAIPPSCCPPALHRLRRMAWFQRFEPSPHLLIQHTETPQAQDSFPTLPHGSP